MATKRSALAGVCALALLSTGGVSLAQGVIAPPPEGQPIAPQPPVAETVTPNAEGVPVGSAQPRMQGPASVADLAEGLLDAVVNISTAQNVRAAGRGLPPMAAPDGSPLQEFFDDLLDEGDRASRQNRSLGSGFVVDPAGLIVTNNHVIDGADEITVNFADGSALEASVVGVDPKTDIAVLRVEPDEPLAAVEFGDSQAVRIGDWVMAIGNPFGLGGSVSVGIVSARGRRIADGPYEDFIQTDAAINRGNSGGPLFDMYGRVIGINTAIISPTGGSIGIGFSIPALLAENVVSQLSEFGETRRGWLGIRLQTVSEDIAEGLGFEGTQGALVTGIIPDGPSDTGTIEIGDVIVGFDGREVASSRDLPRIVAETPVGKTVTVRLLRKASLEAPMEEIAVEVTLGRLEDGEALMEAEQAGEDGGSAEDEATDEGADRSTLGLRLRALDEAAREEFGIAETVEGLLIVEIDPRSPALEAELEPGQVVVEVGQERVADAEAFTERLGQLRSSGQRNAAMLVAAPNGDLRFVVLPLD